MYLQSISLQLSPQEQERVVRIKNMVKVQAFNFDSSGPNTCKD